MIAYNKIYWNAYKKDNSILGFYGITKDPETKEFIMIIQFANFGNLRSVLLNNFYNILWKDKIFLLFKIIGGLKRLHKLKYSHKNLHSGNILQDHTDKFTDALLYISDFGLSGPADKQKSDNKIHGVLPYVAPEVLNGESYTKASDIYSFGIIMVELSSGIPPFYDKKDDLSLTIDICNGYRPEFRKGTPEFYKKLASSCMNANPNQRPTAIELYNILLFWWDSLKFYYQNVEKYGYHAKEINKIFNDADKEIPLLLFANQEYQREYKSQLINTLPKPISYKNCPDCYKPFIDEL